MHTDETYNAVAVPEIFPAYRTVGVVPIVEGLRAHATCTAHGRHVDGCCGVVDRGRGMVGRGGGVVRLRSMVHYGSMVGLRCVRKGGRSVDPNDGLLVASVAVDGLRRSSGLAVDQRVDGAMGFVDRHVHRGRIALQSF